MVSHPVGTDAEMLARSVAVRVNLEIKSWHLAVPRLTADMNNLTGMRLFLDLFERPHFISRVMALEINPARPFVPPPHRYTNCIYHKNPIHG